MDIYKKACQQRLRFSTTRGTLTAEQLFDLSLAELDKLAVELESSYEESKGKSFLKKRTTKDVTIKLQFDIVLDVLQTKVGEAEAAQELKETKEHNQKILTLISEKKDGELKGKSIKQLEAMLK
jgi:hypothetical protein